MQLSIVRTLYSNVQPAVEGEAEEGMVQLVHPGLFVQVVEEAVAKLWELESSLVLMRHRP